MPAVKKHWSDSLAKLGACYEAMEWLRTQPSAAVAWKKCKRADWMLWIAFRVSGDAPMSEARKPVALAACACARTAFKHIPKGEKRPQACVALVERWAKGDTTVTREQIREARAEAWRAWSAAAAADAADAAADAAAAAAADAAAAAAAAAADAAADAAYWRTRDKALARMATIVRKHIPTAPKLPR